MTDRRARIAATRERLDAQIEAQIARGHFHITLVQQSNAPRFAYTVGRTKLGLPELVLAGASALFADRLREVLDGIGTPAIDDTVVLGEVGTAWRDGLMLGATRRFGAEGYRAVQVLPTGSDRTLDTPDMSVGAPDTDPIWCWLDHPWDLPAPSASVGVTDLGLLRGRPALEVMRVEEATWEIFSQPGPSTTEAEMRVMPIGTLIGIDPTLRAALDLGVGEAMWRHAGGPWRPWRHSRDAGNTEG